MKLSELKDTVKERTDKAQSGHVGDCHIEAEPEIILAVVNEAIAAERERCAKIAEHNWIIGQSETANLIADKIRES